jgi:hypothetical protein
LASNAKFNTLRSGGLFNEWAMLTSKNSTNISSKVTDIYSSQIKPELNGKELIEITDFNKENSQSKTAVSNNLSALKDGVYLLKVAENNKTQLIPYIKNTPKTIEENEIVKSYNKNILELKINTEELKAVNIFDENKNLVKTILQEQYIQDGGVNLNTLENQDYTFEVVTQFYNLQFNKRVEGPTPGESINIFTQNKQIIIKSREEIKNIAIYSISGALIQNLEVNKNDFNSNSLEPGIYLVNATLKNGKTVNRKVKL